MFNTYGPFVLKTHDVDSLHELFSQIRAARADLQYGIGVYIVAAQDVTGAMLPWYVGRTWNEFGTRIVQHFKSEKFLPLIDRGAVTFFLIPLATPKGKVKNATEKTRQGGVKSIRQLEFALIGTCLKLNPALLNKQEATFHDSMYVPGYLDTGSSDRDFAAQALGKLLNT